MAKKSSKLSPLILDEASAWFTEFTAGGLDAGGQIEFNDWLRRSPEHVQAYLQIAAFWEDADLLNASMRSDVDGLMARARQESNVYPLASSSPLDRAAHADVISEPAPAAALAAPRKAIWALAASVALALAGTIGWYAQRDVYVTDIGEQRSVTLDDGSAIEVNARSRLKVRFSQDQRSVELLAGQALFRVAKDPVRPFVVQSGETRVRAVGTQFDVYRKTSGTVVTVVEGKVAVGAEAKNHEAVYLSAGEQLVVGVSAPERAAAKPHRANVAVATAWTQKKLVFDGVPLREVVEEFNRYNRRQLVIRDPSLAEFHVSGVFPSTDSARMLDILRRRFGVVLDESGETIEILAPAERNF